MYQVYEREAAVSANNTVGEYKAFLKHEHLSFSSLGIKDEICLLKGAMLRFRSLYTK